MCLDRPRTRGLRMQAKCLLYAQCVRMLVAHGRVILSHVSGLTPLSKTFVHGVLHALADNSPCADS